MTDSAPPPDEFIERVDVGIQRLDFGLQILLLIFVCEKQGSSLVFAFISLSLFFVVMVVIGRLTIWNSVCSYDNQPRNPSSWLSYRLSMTTMTTVFILGCHRNELRISTLQHADNHDKEKRTFSFFYPIGMRQGKKIKRLGIWTKTPKRFK